MAKLDQGILGPFRGKVGTVVGYLWRGKHVVRAYRREINYPDTERQQAEREWFVGMVRFAATARKALLLGLRERAAREQMTEGNAFVKMNKGCFGREAAGRVRAGVSPLRPSATSPCEGEERKSTIRSQMDKLSGCTSCEGEVRKSTIGSQMDRLSGCTSCEGEERKSTIRSQMDRLSGCTSCEGEERKYAAGSHIDRTSSSFHLQGEFPEGVRGGVDYERIRIAEGSAAPVLFTGAGVDEDGVLRARYEKNSGMTRAKGSDRVYVYIYNTDTREGLLSAPAERRSGGLAVQLPDGWNYQNIKLWGFVMDREGHASNSAFIPLQTPEIEELTQPDAPEAGEVHEKEKKALNVSAFRTPGGT